ncbi:zinc phosphodiesterase ELAC protein 1-like [Thrips palmi]|uniref:Zinc phosphodiesterase ELAC protein 1-like n=1 Tax=Thrips palmi TaxID=161013 RepID=A0A6P8ZVB2_THRPL|nr:zinc phosphodiesterase ELAC protein 1-like [Thrips palmi]
MQLIFLGTASCYPTAHRAVSCTGLRFEDGFVWLFDCGEGSQVQVQKSSIRPSRITKIFITHLHGDHLFGISGLICTLGNQVMDRKDFVLELYGPRGLRRYVREVLCLSRSPLPFPFRVHELIPMDDQLPRNWSSWGVTQEATGPPHPQELPGRDICAENGVWEVFEDDSVSVQAGRVKHRVPTFGYVITECTRPGKLNVEKLKELGVKPGPLYATIKGGKEITSPAGHIIFPTDVIGPPIHGRKITILGDTYNSDQMLDLVRNSDVLVHEATLEDSMKEKAIENGHSTPSMAAEYALKADVRKLILYHFSQRYKSEPTEEEKLLEKQASGTGDQTLDEEGSDDKDVSYVSILLSEASSALECSNCSVMVAEDLLEVDIPRVIST